MDNGAPLERAIADEVAAGMKRWATELGVTHYTHWFQPLTEGKMCIRDRPQASIEAMHKAVDELANKETFHGYGPEQGYAFLIAAVIRNDYTPRGVYLEPGEVFILSLIHICEA